MRLALVVLGLSLAGCIYVDRDDSDSPRRRSVYRSEPVPAPQPQPQPPARSNDPSMDERARGSAPSREYSDTPQPQERVVERVYYVQDSVPRYTYYEPYYYGPYYYPAWHWGFHYHHHYHCHPRSGVSIFFRTR